MRRYHEGYLALQPLTEPLNLEKYYDIYDITTIDMQEALTEYKKDEFEDYESLRVLKILISRFVTLRKLVLCCLLALEADGGKEDFTRWRTALEEIKGLSDAAYVADGRVRSVFEQEESKYRLSPTQYNVEDANRTSIPRTNDPQVSPDSWPRTMERPTAEAKHTINWN